MKWFLRKFMDARPMFFIAYLIDSKYLLVERMLKKRFSFGWENVGEDVRGFEHLFHVGPLNRGLIRMDIDEAMLLYRSVAALHNPVGVEVGRNMGGSTFLLAQAVKNGKIHSIDIAPKDDVGLSHGLRHAGLLSKVELIVGDANEVEVGGTFDFAFIDGDHSYESAKKDMERWAPRVKIGGLVIFHDMASTRAGSTQWEDLLRLRQEIIDNGALQLVEEAGSLSVFQKVTA